ncbi:MAG TPA: serine hydrolase [Pyrinomonadaceae bacterium]|nr:serine hydrolase [Pyrinomonadaceae bacterium]
MKTQGLPIVLLLVIVFGAASAALAQPTANNSLDSRVRAEVTPFKGKVFLYAKNLDTGQTYSYNGDERVRTASTIKIAVMIEVWSRVAEGKAKWTDELVLTKAARFSGSGILPELGDGLRLTLQDCVRLMMTLSDNTATNMVLDYLSTASTPGTDAVNARMNSLGFKATRIMRRVGSGGDSEEGKKAEGKKFGLGSTSPHEMVDIMEKLERGEIVNAEAAKEMIELMKREQARYAIGRTIPSVTMASKYGALDALRSCVAILYTKQGRIAIAITVDDMPEVVWSVDNPGYLLMSRLSQILIEGLGGSKPSSP